MTPRKRYSKQRESVLNAARNLPGHPTAKEIFATVRWEIPNVSLGTVYRNLNVLAEDGRIREFTVDDNIKRYDSNLDEHYHCICKECGRIYDKDLSCLSTLEELTRHLTDFEVQDYKLECFGICSDCQSTKKSETGN